MEAHEHKFCPATWFSGFFALGALVHLARAILGFPLTVGTFEVPVGLSWLVAVIAGGLSVALAYVGIRRPCCRGKE